MHACSEEKQPSLHEDLHEVQNTATGEDNDRGPCIKNDSFINRTNFPIPAAFSPQQLVGEPTYVRPAKHLHRRDRAQFGCFPLQHALTEICSMNGRYRTRPNCHKSSGNPIADLRRHRSHSIALWLSILYSGKDSNKASSKLE